MRLSDDGLEKILNDIGVQVYSDTHSDFICYCPIHLNRDSPAFNIGKEPPYPFRCWNPKCDARGTLVKLIMTLCHKDIIGALKMMNKYRTSVSNLSELIEKIKDDQEDTYDVLPESLLEKVKLDYDKEPEKLKVFEDRGITRQTIEEFRIGYSQRRRRLTIPVWDEDKNFVGFSGRAVTADVVPKYWDRGLPKRHILFNLDNARSSGEAIIVEGPIDAIKVWQAGYKNVVAFFGGGFSNIQAEKLTKTFKEVTIFTDNDEPGRAFVEKIAAKCREKGVTIYVVEYPDDRKDPGELNEKEIQHAIENKLTYLQYRLKTIGGNNYE